MEKGEEIWKYESTTAMLAYFKTQTKDCPPAVALIGDLDEFLDKARLSRLHGKLPLILMQRVFWLFNNSKRWDPLTHFPRTRHSATTHRRLDWCRTLLTPLHRVSLAVRIWKYSCACVLLCRGSSRTLKASSTACRSPSPSASVSNTLGTLYETSITPTFSTRRPPSARSSRFRQGLWSSTSWRATMLLTLSTDRPGQARRTPWAC